MQALIAVTGRLPDLSTIAAPVLALLSSGGVLSDSLRTRAALAAFPVDRSPRQGIACCLMPRLPAGMASSRSAVLREDPVMFEFMATSGSTIRCALQSGGEAGHALRRCGIPAQVRR